MYILFGPIREILDSDELSHKQFMGFGIAIAVLFGLTLIGLMPWVFCRFSIFVLEIASKRVKYINRINKGGKHE